MRRFFVGAITDRPFSAFSVRRWRAVNDRLYKRRLLIGHLLPRRAGDPALGYFVYREKKDRRTGGPIRRQMCFIRCPSGILKKW